MTEKFSKTTARNYANALSPYNKKITDKKTLTNGEVVAANKLAIDYYDHLINSGVAYGQAAKDVATNANAFGRFANHHLIETARYEGKAEEKIPTIQNNVRIALAYQDADLRAKNAANDGFIPYSDIGRYHYKVLETQGLSKYAWGGAFFETFAGSGSWMDLGGYDTSIDIAQEKALLALKNNAEEGGLNARQAFGSIAMTATKHPTDAATAMGGRGVNGLIETMLPTYNEINKNEGTLYVANGLSIDIGSPYNTKLIKHTHDPSSKKTIIEVGQVGDDYISAKCEKFNLSTSLSIDAETIEKAIMNLSFDDHAMVKVNNVLAYHSAGGTKLDITPNVQVDIGGKNLWCETNTNHKASIDLSQYLVHGSNSISMDYIVDGCGEAFYTLELITSQ